MAFDLGWKKKTDRLRMAILSAGHQIAKELPPGMAKILELFRQAHRTKDGSHLMGDIERVPRDVEPRPMLWEPIEVHGWMIAASMYLQNGQLWWIVQARRCKEKSYHSALGTSAKDIVFLHKVLEHLGADLERDVIIGPNSSPPGEPPLPFGWWTWFNRDPLYDVQVKGQGTAAQLRIVPIGSREDDGFTSVDLTVRADAPRCVCGEDDGSGPSLPHKRGCPAGET